MDENHFSNSKLAQKLDFSYEYIYKIRNNKADMSDGFKWRFAEVFGFDLAINLFGPVAEPATEGEQPRAAA